MTEDPKAAGARPETRVRIGQGVQGRRELVVKALWIAVWLVFLGSPIRDLTGGRHTTAGAVAGAAGLTVFVGVYLTLVFRQLGAPFAPRTVALLLGTLLVLAPALTYGLGTQWSTLFVYLSVACGATLPLRLANWAIPGSAVLMYLVGLHWGVYTVDDDMLMVVLIGFAMVGVGQLVRTTVELRKARATVAQLAANEERLRLARDLHDLLGHSLSLITLKSELAGRMLPDHPDKAAQQIGDIEQVSRQALVDVREAVTGYRRPRLAVELAGTQVALTAAGVAAELPPEPDLSGVPEEAESALAWALREAVTNVVRHSGADRCAVRLTHHQTLAGPMLELAVEDNGSGVGTGGFGNGLTGLTERLQKAGGTLEAARVKHGFRLVARVPVAPAGDVGSGA